MILNIKVYKDPFCKSGHHYLASSFLQTNEKDGTDRITFGDNPAEIQRLVQIAKDVESMVDNYSFDGLDGSASKADSSS